MKGAALEVPPSGAGVNTVISFTWGVDKSAAGIVTLSLMLLTNVVGRFSPFQRTMEFGKKTPPKIPTVISGAPVNELPGEIAVICGAGTVVRPVPDRATEWGLPAA